jgi:protein-tyrosine-phosphatase
MGGVRSKTMKRYDKLIFVSNSDTCIGPMAKYIMLGKFLLEDLEIESRGRVVLFPEPANQKAEAVMMSHGITMKGHEATPLSEEDFGERTLILVMDGELKKKISEEYTYLENVYLLKEYIGSTEEITDPLGGTLVDYGERYETMEKMISRLVVILNEQELLEEK